MWKRRRTWLLLVALTGVALAVYFEPSHCVRGWLWREAFFDGRPTSYWRGVIQSDMHMDPDTYFKNQPPNWWARCKNRVGFRPDTDGSARLIEDQSAACVLQEITGDPDTKISGFATDVLKYHQARAKSNVACSMNGDYIFLHTMILKHNGIDQGVADFFK
jgi:hypothetical protein